MVVEDLATAAAHAAVVPVVVPQVSTVPAVAASAVMAEHNLQRVPAELDLEEQVVLEAVVMEVMELAAVVFRPLVV